MMAIIESQNGEAASICKVMLLGVMVQGCIQCELVGFGGGVATSQVNLVHAWWCIWHDLMSEKVSEIMRWKRSSINFMGNKSIIQIGTSGIY